MRHSVENPRSSEGGVNHPLFQGRFFDKATANALNARLAQQPHKILDAATTATQFSNAFVLALDWSAPFVQGQPLLWWSIANRKPTWLKAYAESAKAWIKPEYMRRAMETPEYRTLANELAQLGVSLGRLQDYMAGTEKGAAVTRLPIIGGSFRRAGASFGAFMDIAKLEWWKVLRETTPRSEWPRVAESMENLLGVGRSGAIGVNPQLVQAEGLAWRAAAYYRSGVNALANLADKGASGKVTRQAIGSMLGGITASFVGLALMKGLSFDEIKDKLARLDFTLPFKIPYSDRQVNIGFNHIVLSLLKLIPRTVQYIADGNRIDEGGVERNPIMRWLWSHSAMIPSATTEAISSRDFLGSPATLTSIALKQVTPIGVQQIGGTAQKEGYLPAIGDALPTAMGLNAYPENYRQMWVRKANEISRNKFGKNYDQLIVRDQLQVAKELNKDSNVSIKPRATVAESNRANYETEKRRVELLESLSSESKDILNKHGLSITGYDPSLTYKGTQIYLTRDQRAMYADFLRKEYDATIARLPRLPAFQQGGDPVRKIKALEVGLSRARERALGLFLRQERANEVNNK